ERERGITILSKNCAVRYPHTDGTTYKINIIDTPGHADFGGEVERVLKMADGCLLLVDAFDGPMPQTRFVMQKALANGLKPIVVVNKIDRPDARPDQVVDEVFDLLVSIGANDEALDFPIIYASAREGWATLDLDQPSDNLLCVFETVLEQVPPPADHSDTPLQMLVTTLEYSDYVGRIAVGRIVAGHIEQASPVTLIDRDGNHCRQRVLQVFEFDGLGKRQVETLSSGDIAAVVGLDPVNIGDTIACPDQPEALPPVPIDEPTLDMTFRVNNGPFSGREGKYVTSRQIGQRLQRELQSNVALKVAQGEAAEEFRVSGRGLLHLGVLLETMRREGYELCVGKPQVILKEVDGKTYEPIERLTVDSPVDCQNAVMALAGERRGELVQMDPKAGTAEFVHMEFTIPARGLIGLRSRMLNATQGRAIMHHTFHEYELVRGAVPQRQNGVMIATQTGMVTAYALDSLYDRGIFFVKPGESVYEGQVVGEHCMENDITVNVVKAKQLTNIRTHSKDDAAKLRPVREMEMESALEYIQDDELVEITPGSIRLRKRLLTEVQRRRAGRK
ncbi:MAG: translational GTPase TypA, partial [Planctomycetota bacterium]